jgi:hypothetical protein
MRLCVYLKIEDSSLAAHHKASLDLAELILCGFLAERIRQDAIQLTTDDTWAEMKDRFRRPTHQVDLGESVFAEEAVNLPVRKWAECLILQYPLPDQRSMVYA